MHGTRQDEGYIHSRLHTHTHSCHHMVTTYSKSTHTVQGYHSAISTGALIIHSKLQPLVSLSSEPYCVNADIPTTYCRIIFQSAVAPFQQDCAMSMPAAASHQTHGACWAQYCEAAPHHPTMPIPLATHLITWHYNTWLHQSLLEQSTTPPQRHQHQPNSLQIYWGTGQRTEAQ